jgi:hypothetical protein
MVGLVFAFAGMLLLIADLDRPTEGSLTTSQEAMIDLQRSMRTGQPGEAVDWRAPPTIPRNDRVQFAWMVMTGRLSFAPVSANARRTSR